MTNSLKTSIAYVTKRDKITILCLLGPLFLKYLLPGSMEEILKFNFGGAVFFLPYFLLFVFINRGHKTKHNSVLKKILGVQFIFSIISWILGDYENGQYFAYFENLSSYFICYYIATHYQFTLSQLCFLRRIVSIVFLLVSVELILVNLGLVSFGVQQADTEVVGGVSRYTTTMGDTNNGGVAFFMFGMLTVYLNKYRKLQILYLFLWVVGCFLTVTKSVCLAVVFVGIAYYCKMLIDKKTKILTKLKYTLAIFVSFFVLYEAGVFNPIIERVSMQYATKDLESGRGDLREDVLKKISGKSFYIGHGSGCVYPIEEIGYQKQYSTPYRGAPHNSYIIQFAEGGIIGLSLMLLFWLVILVKNRKRNMWLMLSILSMIGIFFNTETVSMVYTENQLILAILLMLLINPAYEKNLI